MIEAGGHHHYVLPRSVGACQYLAQVVQVLRVPHRHQDAPRTNPECAAPQLLVGIHPELVELLRLAMPVPMHLAFREGENGEEDNREDCAGDGGFLLGE